MKNLRIDPINQSHSFDPRFAVAIAINDKEAREAFIKNFSQLAMVYDCCQDLSICIPFVLAEHFFFYILDNGIYSQYEHEIETYYRTYKRPAPLLVAGNEKCDFISHPLVFHTAITPVHHVIEMFKEGKRRRQALSIQQKVGLFFNQVMRLIACRGYEDSESPIAD